MSDETGVNPKIRNYLLGDLSESEAEIIERWYFADGQAVDEVWAVFGEIAEERLSGALSQSEAQRFEQRLRSLPAFRKMFENEQALYDHAARIATSASRQVESDNSVKGAWRKWRLPASFFKPGRFVVAGVIAMIALGIWFALRAPENRNPERSQQAKVVDQSAPEIVARPSLDPQLPPQSGRGANDSSAERPVHKPRPDQPKSPPGFVPEITTTFLLLAAGTREGESHPTLEIPPRTQTVQLELEPPTDDCSVYSAVLQTESGEELQRWARLRTRRVHSTLKIASLRVPADSLKNTVHMIRLKCVSGLKNPGSTAQYRFKVEKK